MTRQPTTPVSFSNHYAREMMKGLEHYGLDSSEPLKTAGIDRNKLQNPKARINLKQFSRLYMAVVFKLDDEALGLGVTPFRHGGAEIICRAACTGRNLLECMSIMARTENTLWLDLTTRFTTTKEGGCIAWRLRDSASGYPPLLYEVILLSTLGILTWLAGGSVPILRADFPFPRPSTPFELQPLICSNARFDQSEARLWFSPTLASMPLRRQPSDIDKFTHLAPLSFIESILARGLISLRVREILRDALPTVPTINQIAHTLALSPRTLHRKLEQEGESFQSIKDSLRCDLAIQALTRGHTPIKQIAIDLGFSDQTTFQRAFTAWTGTPPGAYRQDQGS